MYPNQLTSDQTEQIKSWAEQRDAILLEISTNRTENENLILKNKSLAESNTDIEGRVNILTGRLEELSRKEKEFGALTNIEVADSIAKRSVLQRENIALEKDIGLLKSKKDLLIEMITVLTNLHDKVFQRAGVLDQVVDRVTKVNADNIAQVDIMVSKLKTSVEGVIGVSNKNIADVEHIIEKLPRMFVELKRSSLARPQPVLNVDRKNP